MDRDQGCNFHKARDSTTSGGERLVRKWTGESAVSIQQRAFSQETAIGGCPLLSPEPWIRGNRRKLW
jgi:hypothetical protein